VLERFFSSIYANVGKALARDYRKHSFQNMTGAATLGIFELFFTKNTK